METEDQEFSNASDEDFTNLDSSTDSDAVSEHSSDDESENSTQADSKTKKKKQKKSPAKKSKKATKHKIVFNVSDTQYDVVKYVGKKIFKWKLSYDKESPDWDVFWTDNAVQPETLARMQTYQKINHFPGMYSLARKNHLGRNLMRMKRAFPEQFKFFPQTFLLPSEYGEFRLQFNKKKAKTFIVKPEASCQGRGIFLTRTSESVQPGEHYVAQRYIHKPYLIDGLKFDMRIYVLLAGCDPLKIFLYDDGLGRFATEEYVAPTGDNLDNVCMHLTNYAINKDNPNFVFNESSSADDVGHKRSLKAVMRTLKEQGHDVDALWKEIRKIIIKTFCSVQPILAHSYKSCHPDEPYNNMCFELLGFDVMLDHKLKPWLIEVNHTPSFTTDTPLDKQIKKSAIRDALKLMNISIENTNKMKNKKRAELQQRVLTGKKVKTTPEERQAAFEKAQLERNSWEAKNHGRYTKIFPFDDPAEAEEDYEEFMRVANKWWEEWTGTSIKRNVKKQTQQEPNKPPPMVFGQGPSNMSTRAKEIQSIYSQKLKTGPYSSKPGSVQNQRMSQASSTAYNSPHNKQVAVNPNKTMKTREWEENSANMNMQGGTKELDDDNKNYMNHLAAIAEVEGNMDTIPEDHEEDWYGKGQDLAKQRKTIQTQQAPGYKRDTLAKETSSGLPQATEAALNSALEGKVNGARSTSFRITNKLSQQTKESPQKPAGERGVSEDPKFHFSRKFAHYLMSDKIEDGNPTHESKAVLERETETRAERERESYNSRKTPLKMSNGILGTFGMVTESLWHGANGTGAMMSIDADREPRNVSVGGLMRIDAKNEYNMKSASKKTTVVVPTQYKQTKNYVAPRLYEMTGGASKEGGPVKTTSNNGLGLSLQGLGVGNKVTVPANPRESNSGLNYFQDSQASVQKYYNFLTRGKK